MTYQSVAMQSFEWRPLSLEDWEKLDLVRRQFHRAIQNVSAVGRRFSPNSRNDEHAVLTWIPGLSRLAGQWVKGNITFRSSISFNSFSIFLVDEKVVTLSEFDLQGKTHRQVMLWLEEQIGKFGLKASNLAMKLPYELPSYETYNSDPFHIESMDYARELGSYYHNAYVTIRSLRQEFGGGPIKVWPHHFDLAMDQVIKDSGDPETTTKISLGMSPGDETYTMPYFYINTWPHVDALRCSPLSNGMWISENWTGAVLPARDILGLTSETVLKTFYQEAAKELTQLLTD